MHSDLVFTARRSVANAYLLCRLTARTARVLHFASSSTQDAITDAFVRIGNQPHPGAAAAHDARLQNHSRV